MRAILRCCAPTHVPICDEELAARLPRLFLTPAINATDQEIRPEEGAVLGWGTASRIWDLPAPDDCLSGSYVRPWGISGLAAGVDLPQDCEQGVAGVTGA